MDGGARERPGGGWLPPEGAAPPPASEGPAQRPPRSYDPPRGYGPPPGAYGQPPGGYPHGSHAPPGPGAQEPGNTSAVTSLVLAIVSLSLLLVSAGVSSLLSVGLSIAAIPLGRSGRARVDRGETRKHRTLAQAGFVLGIVGAVLAALATLIWALLIAFADDFLTELDHQLQEDLDSQLEQGSIAPVLVRSGAIAARGLLG